MKTTKLSKDEVARLRSLAGKKIVSAEYVNENEGTYRLIFEDKSVASFTSSGDDHTFTIFSLEER